MDIIEEEEMNIRLTGIYKSLTNEKYMQKEKKVTIIQNNVTWFSKLSYTFMIFSLLLCFFIHMYDK